MNSIKIIVKLTNRVINNFPFLVKGNFSSSSSSKKNCRAVARGTTPQRLSHDSCADFYIISK